MDNKVFRVQTLNNISDQGLERLPRARYEVASSLPEPHGIILRSHNMHDREIPDALLAVARAGAGVNNIPLQRMTEQGIPVFNAPGANANAVKELVMAGLFLASRNICQAAQYVQNLPRDDVSVLKKQVEAGKKRYAGFELPGRKLGVIGLGAIGRLVANAALDLGMEVFGFDPGITVEGAWSLSSRVQQANSIDDLLSRVDVLSLHIPLLEQTRGLINAQRLAVMPAGSVVLNFSRDGIVDNQAVLAALDEGQLHAYICDFPEPELMQHEQVVCLPHLGASTQQAEDNCAVMVCDQLRDFLEDGNVRHSVNFPKTYLSRRPGKRRITIVNHNIPNMVGQLSTCLAEADLNILDLINKSRGDMAYTLIDVDTASVDDSLLAALSAVEGVVRVRVV